MKCQLRWTTHCYVCASTVYWVVHWSCTLLTTHYTSVKCKYVESVSLTSLTAIHVSFIQETTSDSLCEDYNYSIRKKYKKNEKVFFLFTFTRLYHHINRRYLQTISKNKIVFFNQCTSHILINSILLIKSLDTPSPLLVFLYLYYFQRYTSTMIKTSILWKNVYGNM